jgi:Polyketide cyclase / dehydrase and lipid transport
MASSIIRKSGIVLASLVGVAAVGGIAALTLLPKTVHIERSAVVSAAPNTVFAALSSPKSFHQFNPFKDVNPDLTSVISGPAQGIGAQYTWASSGGSGSQTIVSMKQDAEIKMQLELGFRGRPIQTFLISPVVGGSKVTWVQDGDLGYNPIARIIGTTLDGKLGPIYENGLQKLGKLLATQTSSVQ